jgi:hypothetical protein
MKNNDDQSMMDCGSKAYDDGKVDSKGNHVIKPKGYFDLRREGYIDFEGDGMITFQTERSCRAMLTDQEAKQFFLAMMNHYKANNDRFWE